MNSVGSVVSPMSALARMASTSGRETSEQSSPRTSTDWWPRYSPGRGCAEPAAPLRWADSAPLWTGTLGPEPAPLWTGMRGPEPAPLWTGTRGPEPMEIVCRVPSAGCCGEEAALGPREGFQCLHQSQVLLVILTRILHL